MVGNPTSSGMYTSKLLEKDLVGFQTDLDLLDPRIRSRVDTNSRIVKHN